MCYYAELIKSYAELIKSMAKDTPDAKYAFTRHCFCDWSDHLVKQYKIFDKPHGEKLFELTNSYGDFAINGAFMDKNDRFFGNLYGDFAMAFHAMDAQIKTQERALDDLIYNHCHEFNITGNKFPSSGFTTDGIYRVWLNGKLQFIVNEGQDNNVYMNRPDTIACRPFDMIIPKQTLINLVNRQK